MGWGRDLTNSFKLSYCIVFREPRIPQLLLQNDANIYAFYETRK